MSRIRLFLALVVLSACTTTITEVIEVYPTELTIISSVTQINVGELLGVGANASIIGRKEFQPKDSISVAVRDETVLRVVADFRGQQLCSPGGFFSGVCLQRWIDLRALKVGTTYVVFRAGGAADSVRITVNQPKG